MDGWIIISFISAVIMRNEEKRPGGWLLPFDGEGQVLHLRVLLFDLLDAVHDDILQLRYQPGLSQTEVLVQRSGLFIPGRRQDFLRFSAVSALHSRDDHL